MFLGVLEVMPPCGLNRIREETLVYTLPVNALLIEKESFRMAKEMEIEMRKPRLFLNLIQDPVNSGSADGKVGLAKAGLTACPGSDAATKEDMVKDETDDGILIGKMTIEEGHCSV